MHLLLVFSFLSVGKEFVLYQIPDIEMDSCEKIRNNFRALPTKRAILLLRPLISARIFAEL